MTLRNCALAVLLFMLTPGPSWAQDVTHGWYMGATFNLAFENFRDTGGLDFDEGLGAGIRLGSRLHPNLAIEAQYEWSGELEDDFGPFEFTLENHVLTANAKIFPVTGRIEPFVLAGAGYSNTELEVSNGFLTADDDIDAFVARFGAGLQAAINESASFALEGGYVLPTGSARDLPYFTLSLGLTLHFDGI